MDDFEVCQICGKEVRTDLGQARHGLRGGHWDCHYPNGSPHLNLKDQIKKTDDAIARTEALIRDLERKIGRK